MELKVEEIKALEPIKFNYEELKKELKEKVKNYKNLVYTDENIETAKADRANLNKLKKALDDEKKRIKSVYLEPYSVFEAKIKELIGIVDVAAENVDSQVKDYEQKIKDKKKEEIETFFNENVGEYKELINLDKIFNPKWLNKTYKIEEIKKEIKILFAKVNTDMEVLNGQFEDKEINIQLKNYYFNNIGDPNILTLTMVEAKKIEENNKKIAELNRQKIANSITNNVTVSTENPQKVDKREGVTEIVKDLTQIDFRVWVTVDQMKALKLFLIENHIKYGKVV